MAGCGALQARLLMPGPHAAGINVIQMDTKRRLTAGTGKMDVWEFLDLSRGTLGLLHEKRRALLKLRHMSIRSTHEVKASSMPPPKVSAWCRVYRCVRL